MHCVVIRSGWILPFILFLLIGGPVHAQLSGVKSIPGDYAAISLAVTALNSSGVGAGGVTFNIAANYTETISSTISITTTGSAVNPVIFQKDPSTSGANPLITAYTTGVSTPASAVQDGIWRLVGSDYVTIRNIDIRDNPLNVVNPSTMEYGFALYKASITNGCQNVRIEGCTITLNRINNASATNPMTEGSAGIIVMNATAVNAIIVLGTPGIGGGNSNNRFYSNTIQNCNIGISMIGAASSTPFTNSDTNNDVGGNLPTTGNTIINYGGAAGATNASAAIRTLNQYAINISYNAINNNNGSGVNHPTTLHGILNGTATSASATITNNNITLRGGGTTTNITAIENAAGSTTANNTINISNNSIVNGTYATATTGTFFGIVNSSSAAALAISSNILTGSSTSATSGTYAPIRNTGAVTTAITINNNQIGNGVSGAVTFTAANSGAQAFINNAGGTSSAALAITNNNIQGISYPVAGTGANTYIINSAVTLSQAITGNTFTSLNVNTSGNVTFISNSVILSATGTQNINNNSIATSFTKSAGGIVTLFNSSAASGAGGVSNNLNNNFSNITLTGATTMDGWVNTDSGGGTKTIQSNTFSNWTVGTSACNGMNINLTSTSNSISGNTISNISGGGNVTGITTAAGNDKISGNTIHTLSTTGVSVVTGILITAGTNKHVFSNKIYNLQLNNTGNTLAGISVTGTTLATANIYNNLIGDLKAPVGNSGSDVIRGISVTTTSVTSTINVYYNTIYINATSSGTNFSTSGVYHTANAIATSTVLNLRNNIISNTSTPNGTGFTAALRRSLTALNNYATTSNNNLFYAGSQTSNKLLYYDGTNQSQTLTAFKAMVTPMESSSVAEDLVSSLKFVSTTGSSGFFLHLDPAKPTLAETGAINITGFNVDFDGQTRQGNPGYSGTGTAPDIGADEMAGTRAQAMSGTYFVGTGQSFPSLTGASGLFSVINSLGLSGNIVVNVTSDLTEDGSYALLPWVEEGAGNYTITIKPDASVMRTISGNITTGMIRLNGAKRVTIDGSNGSTSNFLTFRNTNTVGTTGTAFTFINGASNNTIAYSNIEAYANATNGVILFSTSTAATGNSSNTITNCSVNATVGANTGSVGIYSLGTTGKENSSNTISNNNIFNFRDRGVDIPATGSTAWTITGNSVYNGSISGSFSYAAGFFLYGIKVSGGSGYTIGNNFIGGSAALATGSNASYTSTLGLITYNGIHLTTTSATPGSSVKGNTIAGITLSCAPTAPASNVLMGIETMGSGTTIGGPLIGDGNTIGSMSTNSSIVITTTTTVTTATSNIYSINCSSSGGQVIGNRTGGIDLQNVGTAPAASTFRGIYVNGVTAPTLISNNTIGGTIANSIRFLSTSAAASLMSGITIGAAVISPFTVTANTMQNMSFQATGGTGTNLYGIANNAGLNSVVTLSNNVITGNSTLATTGGLVGIYSASSSSSVTISGNTVSNNSTTSATSFFYGISPGGSTTPVISITGNTISGNTSASVCMAIYNLAVATTLNINSNTISGNTITSTSVAFFAIYNQGNVTGTININSNAIGTGGVPAVTYSVANTISQLMIQNTGGTAAANLTISNNNLQGIGNTVQATGAYFMIANTAATLSQTISGNLFTNLSINTTGSVTLISNNVVLSATGTQNINNNSISGTFAKTGAGGGVTGFSNSSASSLAGSVINHNNNNFSNITVSGATTVTGWLVTDPGNSTRNIYNNTFSNWTVATGAVSGLSLTLTSTLNTVTGNTISGITSSGTISGIACAGSENVFLNTIHSLTSVGDNSVNGINVTGGGSKNIHRNKIYNLSKTISGATTFATTGIAITAVAASSTTNIYNNIIGDLRAATASSVDVVRGIGILASAANSTINVYYNTIHINATSTGTNFGTSALFHTASLTATTASLDLRNNILANYSTPNGTGRAVAFRRSAATLSNFATTSNNNLFYAGTASATHLLYFDGTNSDQTMVTYQLRVLFRELNSVTENITPALLNTTGSSALFLHINSAVTTAIESGGANIASYTIDFDGQIRAGNPGYSGPSTTPDIGADEIFGIETIAPVITYTLLPNTSSTANVVLAAVTITDASGVNVAAGTKPRIYYKRLSDGNAWLDNTPATSGWKYTDATNAASPFSFTIDYALLYGGATSIAGAIQYFVVAQDNATTANVAINSGTFAVPPSSVALTGAAFALAGTINSYYVSFAGTYNVGATEAYTSLTRVDGLFAAINNAGMNTSVTVNVTSDLSEDGAIALNQWTETGAGGYTLTIRPDAGIPRVISGNALNGLIRFDGADRVNIDGRNGGIGPFLRFVNTNTLGTSGTAFTFINGSSNNTIQYSEIQAYADATHGVILLGTSTAPAGNISNTIDNCAISSTVGANTGNVAICSLGTAGKENSSIVISNNIVSSYKDRAIDVAATGSSSWAITGNSFYNGDISSSISYAASSALQGLRVQGGSGYSILNNYIGGSSALASGNAVYTSSTGNVSFNGVLLTTTSATPASVVRGNTISGIAISSVPTAASLRAFSGIETSGQGISIGGSGVGEGNIVGSTTANGAITVTTSTTSAANTTIVTAINCQSIGGSIIGNQIGGIDVRNIGSSPAASTIIGISVSGTTAPTPISSNIIGGLVSNSIRVLASSTALATVVNAMIATTGVTAPITFDGNTIQNISNLSSTSSGSFIGINNTAASTTLVTISNNIIQGISAAANISTSSGIYTGIYSQSTSTINNNTINNMVSGATGTFSQVRGIWTAGAIAHTISSNTISNLATASTRTSDVESASPTDYVVAGILSTATTGPQAITGNTLFGFSATSSSTINTTIAGIAVTASSSGNIQRNRINAFSNNGTGTSTLPGIAGVAAFNGTFNVYNNAILLTNANNTNRVRIYGMIHGTTSAWNYFYNTIVVSGNVSGTARSASFIRTANASLGLRNNIFLNTRNGTGPHYAISNTVAPASSNWTGSTSDYNDLFSSSTIGEWGSTPSTFAQWQTLSGGDSHSVSKLVTFVISANDLAPDPLANCSINNAAIPITLPVSITTDIVNTTRHATTPDIGAYEFDYATIAAIAGNNSPVCNASPVALTADPGAAINPTFSWTDPGSNVISTLQNPSVSATVGTYTVTVTDATGCTALANTNVSTLARPTAAISGTTMICNGSSATITLNGTGTGTLNGTVSSGDGFNGIPPSFTFGVTPITTAIYTLSTLSDNNCAALPQDLSGTVTITVNASGHWYGTSSTDWNDALNWCGGIPLPTTNVQITSGTPFSPEVTVAGGICSDLTIDASAFLTLIGTTALDLKGDFTNNGTFNAGSGTIIFSGSTIQNITSATVTRLYNLTVTNTNSPGLRVQSSHELAGVLTLGANAGIDADGSANTSVFTLLSLSDNPTQDASIASLPPGSYVTGNVTVQRFMSIEGDDNGRIYRYISSPLQGATVADIQNEIPVTGPFTGASTCPGCSSMNPSIYEYNETIITDTNNSGTADRNDGYVAFPTVSNSQTFVPGRGYAMYVRGNLLTSASWNVRGVINVANVTPLTLPVNFSSSGNIIDDGWNLVGNPFPSAIDWNASSGWTKNNLDAAIYTTDNGNGPTQYATWNGVTGTNGGSRYLATAQAFWVKANTASPLLQVTEPVKSATQTTFFREAAPSDLLRITMTNASQRDETVIHLRSDATNGFDSHADAIKLENSSFNLSTLDDYGNNLAINSRSLLNCAATLKLIVGNATIGSYRLDFSGYESFAENTSIMFIDSLTSDRIDLRSVGHYDFSVTSDPATTGINRFSLIISLSAVAITQSGTQLLSNYDEGNQWYLDGQIIDGATQGFFEPQVNGLYHVEVSSGDCKISSDRKEFIITEADEEVVGKVTASPNPAKDKLTIFIPAQFGEVLEVRISNILGQIVGKVQVQADGDNKVGDFLMTSLPSGSYFIHVTGKHSVARIQVIKE